MDISAIEVIKQMGIVIPSIITATCTFTALIKGMFDVSKQWVNHLISWLISILCAEGYIFVNGFSFGLGGWDYAVGAVCGLIVGASANGIYDWEVIKNFFDGISNLFPSPVRKAKEAEYRAKLAE